MVQLSQRLARIAAWVPQAARLADIGTDHALLPVWLAEAGRIRYAVAGEVNEGPWRAALRQVELCGVGRIVQVRQGDGLQVVRSGEVDTVVIAGMGGALICSILERGGEVLRTVRRLVLQPNVGAAAVRRWLKSRRWVLTAEEIVKEDGKFYEIVVAERKPNAEEWNARLYAQATLPCGLTADETLLLEMGPHLLREGNEWLVQMWEEQRAKLARILQEMENATSATAKRKKENYRKRDHQIREVLECLQTVKTSSK